MPVQNKDTNLCMSRFQQGIYIRSISKSSCCYKTSILSTKPRWPSNSLEFFIGSTYPLIGKLSNFALNKLYDQLEILHKKDFVVACNDGYTEVTGLPCAHVIKQEVTADEPILLVHTHRHWFFDPLQAPAHSLLILNPLPTRSRGRPKGGTSSTCRQLSQFEI